MAGFAHLHLHTEYSLLDASSKIGELAARVAELGFSHCAITDHGNMFGAIEFYKAMTKVGVKPIIGCEVYVANTNRHDKTAHADNFYYHLVLLAENEEGYHNLIKLVSKGFTEGFYSRPRVDKELLCEYRGGIIALSACLSGPVAKSFLMGGYDRAKRAAIEYGEIFGCDNFYLEMQNHDLAEQIAVNEALRNISKETGLPLIVTNDCHYINKEDASAHEILLCIQTLKTINDADRRTYGSDEFYVKSEEQMAARFADDKEAIANTMKVALRCNVELNFHEYKLPKFTPPDGKNPAAYLRELCEGGILSRYGKPEKELLERLDYELGVIEKMGFCEYFLVTWDFIKYAKDNDIPVGPGRGSAAGSIVSYCLNITDIDPIKYNLLFERFLNSERVSMPDIDIDFCYERRQEVIDYVIDKYGIDHVSQIITFGTMAARTSIRDAGRALGASYADCDRLAKMVPFAIGQTLEAALKQNPLLREERENNEQSNKIINTAMKLEGLPRHAGTHAAGVVVCDRAVDDYVPLYAGDGVITTQFGMTQLEELGLLKMDFLGLRTLTVIKKALDEVERIHGVKININTIDTDDINVYNMIAQGKTEGVFQLESAGMTAFMKDLRPTRLEDLIAGISLYRPGPMEFIPKYVAGKNKGAITYTHEKLEPILGETYGCIVYQEQVMRIVRDLAGYSLARADLVRRAMSKKKTDVMMKERGAFIEGCAANGVDEESAEKIFDEMTDFAKYAFNKSHAAAYAVVGYQTAWLRYYYPVEFMAAMMTSCMDFTPKIAEYIDECRKMGIKVLPPDVNTSFGGFSVDGRSIRFGLSAIKNVGRGAAVEITQARGGGPFRSLTDFVGRCVAGINKKSVEHLIKAGAFDSIGGTRKQYFDYFAKIADGAAKVRSKHIEGQMSLMDFSEDMGDYQLADDLGERREFTLETLLDFEKEVTGVYISGHPFEQYAEIITPLANAKTIDFVLDDETGVSSVTDGQTVSVGGIVRAKTVKYTKQNEPMAFITIEDMTGTVEIVVFPKLFAKFMTNLEDGQALVVTGKAQFREDKDATIIGDTIRLLKRREANAHAEASKYTLWLKIPKAAEVRYNGIMSVLQSYPGNTGVIIYDERTGDKRRVADAYRVEGENRRLIAELSNILGEGNVKVTINNNL